MNEYYDLTDPRYRRKVMKTNLQEYGKVQDVSGKAVGAGIAASGIAVPVVLPAPVMAAIGAGFAKKVDKVRLVKTDSQDRPYRIPRIEFH